MARRERQKDIDIVIEIGQKTVKQRLQIRDIANLTSDEYDANYVADRLARLSLTESLPVKLTPSEQSAYVYRRLHGEAMPGRNIKLVTFSHRLFMRQIR